MIPVAYITEWSAHAPWQSPLMVEQDLVISRAVLELFHNPFLREHLAFRGGTALYKLCLLPAARYSEDIDLVQLAAELSAQRWITSTRCLTPGSVLPLTPQPGNRRDCCTGTRRRRPRV